MAAIAEPAVVRHVLLSAGTFRPGSPASGAFLTPKDRTSAAANGVKGSADGAYFAEQPVQGISSMIPAQDGTWWALADGGYGRRDDSADFQLVFHRIDLTGPKVLETFVLHDPERHVPWRIVCDPTQGTPLPDFSFNVMPAPPPACGKNPAARALTGFDFDPESFVRAPDGTFWIGEEYGPYLLHVRADGRLLETPIALPGVRSPQNPFLREKPNLASSRGFEGLAISPDGKTLYGLLEGAVTGDDPSDLRLYAYDLMMKAFGNDFRRVRLEMPSQTVDLAALTKASGARVYPDATPPPTGQDSIGEIKAVNDHQLLMIERDDRGDDLQPPKLKKVFLLDLKKDRVEKTPLVDLLPFLPVFCIESVYPVDSKTILVASDNNYPTSNGRSRSKSPSREGPLAPDDTEIIFVRLPVELKVDARLLPAQGAQAGSTAPSSAALPPP
ncbi:MAG TPA: esterase-like activity of phytase family protein [Candidatus Polarisedimenticolaceae bacterium]|nr:esterase-like activity of phytase family protein [Candidatus Polarisedimenticolaceae bacterium]